MVQVAHAANGTKNSHLEAFYMGVKAGRGEKAAAVALARKTLCHNSSYSGYREPYVEEGFRRGLRLRAPTSEWFP